MINLAEIKNRVKQKWEQLSPEERRKFVLIIIITGLILIAYLGYVVTRGGEQPKETGKKGEPMTKEVAIDTGLLERSYYTESMARYKKLEEEVEVLKKALEEQKSRKEEEKKIEEVISPSTLYGSVPPPPSPTTPEFVLSRPEEKREAPREAPPKPIQQVVGDISIVQSTVQEKEAGKTVEAPKEGQVSKKKYYLPPSFMEATLLSGLDAPAVQKGEGHPVPCLFRIKAPAVLPNKVKANLKGCFVIGEALGNLASERADIRLVSLSCIDRKGKAVIDQKVKGFVVDNDGKIGLRGKVVSKMGSTIARALIAGLATGLGNVFGYQAYTYTYSPEGTLILPKSDEALRAAIGSGVQQAAQQIQQFYLDLAKQTVPVIEILSLRNVTLVVSEGVWLELKDYETYK